MNSYFLNNNQTKINFAVKAVIYNKQGKILLQQRDKNKKIPYPGYWNFFGGLVENEEKDVNALKRELIEELNCIPGKIKNKIHEWYYGNEWYKSKNIFFPIEYNPKSKIILKEGHSYKWFNLYYVVNIDCTPAVYSTFQKIFNFVLLQTKKNKDYILKKIEKNILEKYSLYKKNDRVFYSLKKNTLVSQQQIYLLMNLAKIKNIPVFRLCLHNDDKENLHEMLMIHTKKTKIGPLKQNRKYISYSILDGDLLISKCDNLGKIKHSFKLSSFNGNKIEDYKILRIGADNFRIVRSLSDYCIFFETITGPFKDSDTIWLHKK